MSNKLNKNQMNSLLEKFEEANKSSTKFNYGNIIIAVLSCIFAGLSLCYAKKAVDYVEKIESKFKPIIIEKIQEDDGSKLLQIGNDHYTEKAFLLPTAQTKNLSGAIKTQLIGYFDNYGLTMRNLDDKKMIVVDVSGKNPIEATVLYKNDNEKQKRIGLYVFDIENINVPLVHIAYIGYNSNKSYVTGLLHFHNDKIQIEYLYEEDIFDSILLENIFKNTEINSDIFWKKTNIKDFVSFKNYIINQRKQFIKELEEIGE